MLLDSKTRSRKGPQKQDFNNGFRSPSNDTSEMRSSHSFTSQEEEIDYLMSRGYQRDQAIAVIRQRLQQESRSRQVSLSL